MEIINIEKELLTFDQIQNALNKVLQDDNFNVSYVCNKYNDVTKHVAIKNRFTGEEFRCCLKVTSNQERYFALYTCDWNPLNVLLTEEEYCSLIPIFNKLYAKHEKDLVEKFNECFRVPTADDVF